MILKIYNYNKISSTNNQAIKLISKKNLQQGFVLSNIQTNGKGTRGKKWISKNGNFFGKFGFSGDFLGFSPKIVKFWENFENWQNFQFF